MHVAAREMTDTLHSELAQQLCAQYKAEMERLLEEMQVQQQLLFQSSCSKLLTDFSVALVEQPPTRKDSPDHPPAIHLPNEHDAQPQQQKHVGDYQSGPVQSVYSVYDTEHNIENGSHEGLPCGSHRELDPHDSFTSTTQSHKAHTYHESSKERLEAVTNNAHAFQHNCEAVLKPLFKHKMYSMTSLEGGKVMLKSVVKSETFDRVVNIVILANTMFMAMATNYHAVNLHEFSAPWVRPLDIFFTTFFCIDLVMRLAVDQKKYFTDDKDRWWNMLDLFIVVTTVGEEILNSMATKVGISTKFIRIIRLLRLARALRFLRAARSMAELRALLKGITGSLGTLLWAVLLLILFTFIFALFFTQNVTNFMVNIEDESTLNSELLTNLRLGFGSLSWSMNTLVQGITGGNDWGPISNDLFEVSYLCGFVYLFYCAFGICVLMNVVTGVFISKALDDAMVEKTNFLIADSVEKGNHIAEVTNMFHHADVNGDGVLQKHEFIKLIGHPCVEAYFKFLKLDYEAWEPEHLFDLMDFDDSNAITIDEFVYCCSVLKGSAQRLDLSRAQLQIENQLKQLGSIVKQSNKDVNTVLQAKLNKLANPKCSLNGAVTFPPELLNPSRSKTQYSSVEKKDGSAPTDISAGTGHANKDQEEPDSGTTCKIVL